MRRAVLACALLGALAGVGCTETPVDHLQRARDAIFEKNPDEALVEYRKAFDMLRRDETPQSLVLRARRNKVVTGADSMIGEVGTVITAVAPEGKIFVHGEYWDAVAATPIEAGARVRVSAIDKLKLTVEPLP